MALQVYLEVGSRRTFACAVDWPGWERAAKGPDAALANLADHRDRYGAALALAGLSGPAGDAFEVVETLEGNATTDFGAPGVIAEVDRRPVDDVEAMIGFLAAGWAGFDGAVASSSGELTKGPRGGGRELDAIVAHVVDAEGSYAPKIGVRGRRVDPASPGDIAASRSALVDAVRDAVASNAEPRWPVRFFVRRVTWHALDHAWEIESRSA
jgi:hypothetical protein